MEEKDLATAFGLEIEHRLAVVDVVFGQKFVERVRIAPHAHGFVFVEFAEPVRNLGFIDESRQARQHLAELGAGGFQFSHRLHRCRNADRKLIGRGVTRVIHPFARSDAAQFRLHLSLERNAGAQFPHVSDGSHLRWAHFRRARGLFGIFEGFFQRRDVALVLRFHFHAELRFSLAVNVVAFRRKVLGSAHQWRHPFERSRQPDCHHQQRNRCR